MRAELVLDSVEVGCMWWDGRQASGWVDASGGGGGGGGDAWVWWFFLGGGVVGGSGGVSTHRCVRPAHWP